MKSKFKIITILIGVIVIMSIVGLGALHMPKEINEEKSVSINGINEIKVDMDTVPIHFIDTEESNKVKMHLHGTGMADIKIVTEMNNNTLVVKIQRTSMIPLYEKFILDICIPKDYEKNLSIHTSSGSGSVKMDALNLASFTFNTHSGSLETKELSANKIFLNTDSGKINVKKIDAQELNIKGKSSAINIDECIPKKAELETSTGSITLKNSTGTIGVKTSSGKVLVNYKEFVNQNINIESSTGSVSLELPSSAEFLIDARTSTGKIQSDFEINTSGNNDNKMIMGKVGTKQNEVLLKTKSGSINIMRK